ncbi:copper chaperone PCu(A)C [Pseudoroseomonas globiformis]|uniref:Copper chaperone PCu(A)C n=1 Tax=Teichococcus globiformis TaxID=2307229 RepID=A0ABV7FWL2_9PROT
MTMLLRRSLAAFAVLPLIPLHPVAAQQAAAASSGALAIEQPWARAAVRGGTGGVFMTIRNKGGSADRLVGISSPLPRVAEIHSTQRDGDVMRMRPVEAIEIPAGGSVTLQPGGLHLMLVGLKEPMPAGGSVQVTLTFERAGAITLEVPVGAAGAGGHGHGHSHGMRH